MFVMCTFEDRVFGKFEYNLTNYIQYNVNIIIIINRKIHLYLKKNIALAYMYVTYIYVSMFQ